MIHIGSELGNMGAAVSAQTQQFHDAALRAGAEHLRVAHDALPHHRRRRRLVVALSLLALAMLAGALVAVALVG